MGLLEGNAPPYAAPYAAPYAPLYGSMDKLLKLNVGLCLFWFCSKVGFFTDGRGRPERANSYVLLKLDAVHPVPNPVPTKTGCSASDDDITLRLKFNSLKFN
jgi:hypothetical protein